MRNFVTRADQVQKTIAIKYIYTLLERSDFMVASPH